MRVSAMPIPLSRFGAVIAIIAALPWLGLIGLGGFWLWQHGWLYYGMCVISANIAMVYALMHWRKKSQKAVFVNAIEIQANPNWSDKAAEAWTSLEPLYERWQAEADVLTDASKALKLSNEVLNVVAKHFNANSNYPILEFPLPYLLKLITLVCEDMQRDVLDNIPGSHALKVGDLLRAKKAVDTVKQLQAIFNIGNWLFNWPGAALAKARGILIGKGIDTVTQELQQRLVKAYIGKLGYYAIQLYSGQISLDDEQPNGRLSKSSAADMAESTVREQTLEPLRLLVIGQVSSGKSSLINALFGEIKSAEGLLPTTAETTPYLLERDGLEQAIILDSAGYGGLDASKTGTLPAEWAKTDVILIVCKATQAARQADRDQLDRIRRHFQSAQVKQNLPVSLAVATHIDKLRPVREWQPPYNIQTPDNSKAENIRAACTSIAQALSLASEQVVPVCLASDKAAYNIEDGLLPLIHEHLNAAQRVRFLRCLREQQSASYWRQWRQQAVQAGRIIFR